MIKPPLVTFCSILGLFTVAPAIANTVKSAAPQSAAPHSVQRAAERETVRRQELLSRSGEAITAGNKAMKQKDFETAVQQYRHAVDLLPVSEITKKTRNSALELYGNASVKLAEQRISEGRYADAEAIAKVVLEDRYSPGCRPAIDLLSRLERPDYYNKTITPKHHANVEKVKQLLIEARGFYDIGRYDDSFKRYDQVLNIDPYNITARKGQEEVNAARTDYSTHAYDEARSRMLQNLNRAWEIQPKKYSNGPVAIWQSGTQTPGQNAAITSKLNRIIIPRVEFKEATVRDAVDFLKKRSVDLDTTESDPARKGVNIVLQIDGAGAAGAPAPAAADPNALPGLDQPVTEIAVVTAEPRITLSLSNVPLGEVLRYIAVQSRLKIKIDPYAVAIVPVTEITAQLYTKEYKIPPGFLTNASSSGGGGAASASARTPTQSAGPTSNKMGAREYLQENGVTFSEGSSAQYIASSSRLIVRNTQDQIDLIDTIVEALIVAVPSQIEVEAKFVEISQNNLKELSFDWMLGQFNIGGERIFGGGGTPGTGNVPTNGNFPMVWDNGQIVGRNPITSGNRTGSGLGGAISANAIDALLFPSAGLSSAAPGIFSAAGVFTDPEFQVVVRALNQKKGVDLLSAPRVTTKSGQMAKMEIIREFRYPTEFSPPQIPQTITAPKDGEGGSVGSIPVTPTTPTAFDTRNTGVTLQVTPTVGPDGSTIDLELAPEVVEFEGFINYGSPILGPAQSSIIGGVFVDRPQSVITPNVINQPIFSTRRVSTNVSVWDGQTVALGGLMREDVQKVEDKVPFLGDIPIMGRLFRSSVDQHLKRNLVIFVTARLINPAGEPLNGPEEEPEEATTPMVPEQLQLPGEAAIPLFTK